MTPEFSPSMLRLFLRARCLHAVNAGIARDIDAAKKTLRKAAGVTSATFSKAWAGRLNTAATRAKLWGACGVVPGDHGVILTDDGGQLLASRDAPAASPPVAPEGPRTSSDGQLPLRPVAGVDACDIAIGVRK